MKTDPDRLLTDVGLRAAEIRAERGWIQQQLADRLGVTIRYIQRVEAGQANLTLRSLAELANALKITVGDLLTSPRTRRKGPGRPPASK